MVLSFAAAAYILIKKLCIFIHPDVLNSVQPHRVPMSNVWEYTVQKQLLHTTFDTDCDIIVKITANLARSVRNEEIFRFHPHFNTDLKSCLDSSKSLLIFQLVFVWTITCPPG